ncbi:patatin-like phospholipase family protein [Brevundimonas sp.]|uniref:patatin-like phospholipase family protein n=1 Tax=Brevundimonas sp. TaxID=1871086 RepID=UPI0035B0BBD2
MTSGIRNILVSLAAGLAIGLAGCGTLSRPPDGVLRLTEVEVVPTSDPRIRASDADRLERLVAELADRLQDEEPASVLALSGGGANGAWGAGVLAGWSDTGQRPDFAVVTGVSTGALTAPFAFLGPAWDDRLEAAYTDGAAQGLISWRSFAALFAPSLFSPADLRELVEQHVTPELLVAIAAEHARGRRLLVATTDLDAQETVIWDMGVVATQGGPQGLALFREILVASASIPGVFPPVLIAGLDEQGRVVQTMHVDGGVNAPFLGVPEGLLSWTPEPSTLRGSFYVMVNGQLRRTPRVTGGRLRDILERSFDSASKAMLRSQLLATAEFAHRTGMPLHVAAMPVELEASSLDFDRDSMRRLFEAGRRAGAGGDAWRPFDAEEFAGGTDLAILPSAPAHP